MNENMKGFNTEKFKKYGEEYSQKAKSFVNDQQQKMKQNQGSGNSRWQKSDEKQNGNSFKLFKYFEAFNFGDKKKLLNYMVYFFGGLVTIKIMLGSGNQGRMADYQPPYGQQPGLGGYPQ